MRIRRFRGHGRGGDREPAPAAAGGRAEPVVELDEAEPRQLSAVFSAPRWLRDLGITSWLLVGVTALVVGLVWILGIMSTIVEPVLGSRTPASTPPARRAQRAASSSRWPRLSAPSSTASPRASPVSPG